MKVSDIRQLSDEDLAGKLREEQENYLKLKMNHKVSYLERPISIRDTRRTIARMLTVINERK